MISLLERYTYKDWSEKKPAKKILFNPDPNDESLNDPDPDVAKASKVFTATMTLFGARTLNLTGHHAKSLRNELEAKQEEWYGVRARIFGQGKDSNNEIMEENNEKIFTKPASRIYLAQDFLS